MISQIPPSCLGELLASGLTVRLLLCDACIQGAARNPAYVVLNALGAGGRRFESGHPD